MIPDGKKTYIQCLSMSSLWLNFQTNSKNLRSGFFVDCEYVCLFGPNCKDFPGFHDATSEQIGQKNIKESDILAEYELTE